MLVVPPVPSSRPCRRTAGPRHAARAGVPPVPVVPPVLVFRRCPSCPPVPIVPPVPVVPPVLLVPPVPVVPPLPPLPTVPPVLDRAAGPRRATLTPGARRLAAGARRPPVLVVPPVPVVPPEPLPPVPPVSTVPGSAHESAPHRIAVRTVKRADFAKGRRDMLGGMPAVSHEAMPASLHPWRAALICGAPDRGYRHHRPPNEARPAGRRESGPAAQAQPGAAVRVGAGRST